MMSSYEWNLPRSDWFSRGLSKEKEEDEREEGGRGETMPISFNISSLKIGTPNNKEDLCNVYKD